MFLILASNPNPLYSADHQKEEEFWFILKQLTLYNPTNYFDDIEYFLNCLIVQEPFVSKRYLPKIFFFKNDYNGKLIADLTELRNLMLKNVTDKGNPVLNSDYCTEIQAKMQSMVEMDYIEICRPLPCIKTNEIYNMIETLYDAMLEEYNFEEQKYSFYRLTSLNLDASVDGNVLLIPFKLNIKIENDTMIPMGCFIIQNNPKITLDFRFNKFLKSEFQESTSFLNRLVNTNVKEFSPFMLRKFSVQAPEILQILKTKMCFVLKYNHDAYILEKECLDVYEILKSLYIYPNMILHHPTIIRFRRSELLDVVKIIIDERVPNSDRKRCIFYYMYENLIDNELQNYFVFITEIPSEPINNVVVQLITLYDQK